MTKHRTLSDAGAGCRSLADGYASRGRTAEEGTRGPSNARRRHWRDGLRARSRNAKQQGPGQFPGLSTTSAADAGDTASLVPRLDVPGPEERLPGCDHVRKDRGRVSWLGLEGRPVFYVALGSEDIDRK